MTNCPFCDWENDTYAKLLFTNKYCVCFELPDQVLAGSSIIIPKAHKVTVFDLDDDEWRATKDLIGKIKQYLDENYKPDGYSVGWNCGETGGQHVFHAHLHVVPRYADEPFAGCGIRYWIKSEENRRKLV